MLLTDSAFRNTKPRERPHKLRDAGGAVPPRYPQRG
jgi:hypothetical protein